MKNIIVSLLCAASFFVAAIIASAQERPAMNNRSLAVVESNQSTSNLAEDHATVHTVSRVIAEAPVKSMNQMIKMAAHDNIMPILTGKIDAIGRGAQASAMAPLANSNMMLTKNAVTFTVSYDRSVIGGILRVRGNIVPMFSGIGSAIRANKSYEVVEAIDDLSETELNSAMQRVTDMLVGESMAADTDKN